MIKWWWNIFACQIKELWEASSLMFPTQQTCLWTAETRPIRQSGVYERVWMCIQTRWSTSQRNVAGCRKPPGQGHRSGTGRASKSSLWGRIIRHIYSDTFLSLRASWLPSRYADDHIWIRVHVWHENFDGRVFNVLDGPRRPKSTRRVFRFALFIPPPPDPHPSDSGSGGAAYPASGNFTSCKDKDGGEGENVGEVGVSGGWRVGGVLQLEDIMSTSHPRWKRRRWEKKKRTTKRRHNFQISSDVIY